MQALPEYHRFRIVLKYLHIISSCIWLGAGFSVMVLLYLNRKTSNGDELFALNVGIRYLDDLLIVPAAALCFGSGILICLVANMGFVRCRWIITKWGVTLAAMAFGAVCMAPWMRRLTAITNAARDASFDSSVYLHVYHLDVLFGVLQTLILLYLMLISVLKPCSGFRNCIQCRQKEKAPS